MEKQPNMLEQINKAIQHALKSKENQSQLSVLRMLKSAMENAKIAKKDHSDLTNQEVTAIIRKQVAQRQDSATQFQAGNRHDLADKELQEIKFLETYLPKQWTTEELEYNVTYAISKLGATSKKDMGKVIKLVSDASDGSCDNKRISQLVGKLLN
jgi:uncharacterized protein YqeY